MPRLRDHLEGQRFGFWTVLYEVEKKGKHRAYLCRCDCGIERVVVGASLKNGHSKSCGCKSRKEDDLSGKQFGYWTVIERTENNENGKARYRCRCRCGTARVVAAKNLKNGSSRSCGCLRSETNSTAGNLVGQVFGKWTVLAPAERSRDRMKQYLCRCQCGTERVIAGSYLLRDKTKSCGCQSKMDSDTTLSHASKDSVLSGKRLG